MGSFGGNPDPPADIQPNDSLGVVHPTTLLTANEIEHEATNGTASPEPQPPSPSEIPSSSPSSRREPVTHSRSIYRRPNRFRSLPSASVPPITKQSDVLPSITRGSGTFPMKRVRPSEISQPLPLSASHPRTSLQRHPRSLPQGYHFSVYPPPQALPTPYVRSFTSLFSVVSQTCAPGCWNPVLVSCLDLHGRDNAPPLWIGMWLAGNTFDEAPPPKIT